MTSLAPTVAAGLAAGTLATLVKSRAEEVLQPFGERVLPPRAGAEDQLGADPAGHPEDMPPSEMADRIQAEVTGRSLDDRQRATAAQALHWGTGVGFGIGYAVVAGRVPAVRAGRGLLAGAALFGATHGSGLPLAGLQPAPGEMPRAWWVWEAGSHLVYGVALDAGLEVADRLAGRA